MWEILRKKTKENAEEQTAKYGWDSAEVKTALELLQEYGLKRIAADVCTRLNLQNMEDIGNWSDETIDELNLKEPQTIKLKALRDVCFKKRIAEYDKDLAEFGHDSEFTNFMVGI